MLYSQGYQLHIHIHKSLAVYGLVALLLPLLVSFCLVLTDCGAVGSLTSFHRTHGRRGETSRFSRREQWPLTTVYLV